ncbi:GGDEF domain-containing protein [Kineosporia rhizophila]|uniref:GGDEF domain-containing protein n=1 Tax=Kineosporia rhizophila TaxID=84633 RepID=UPI001E438C73|nr:GGDEF domain-containing protein [Kineosporia rhizophila]MCE0535788.1 GGDEF domain-containing protein [Kineosporia rhizophila]
MTRWRALSAGAAARAQALSRWVRAEVSHVTVGSGRGFGAWDVPEANRSAIGILLAGIVLLPVDAFVFGYTGAAAVWGIVLAIALAGSLALLFSHYPLAEAVRDFVYLWVVATSSSVLLTRGNQARRRLTEQLRRQADLDDLTGLVTRRVLDEAARGALAAGPGPPGAALLVVDLDRFKTINDTYGHPVGDAALKHLAAVLAANTRPDAVIGRMGGDELAVLLPGCDHEVAVRRAEQLVQTVRASPLELPDGTVLSFTVSIGVAHAPTDGRDLPELYASADAALYVAKRDGRDRSAYAGMAPGARG